MRSKSRLALAVVTSPLLAFQEILERRLLRDAGWIIALAGLVAMLSAIVRVIYVGPEQIFVIGRDNPITWVGLWMLYSLVMWGMMRWLGAQLDYESVLIVVGWSGVLLIIHQALGFIWGVAIALGVANDLVVRLFGALGLALPVMYLIAVGRGLQATGRSTFAKGMLVYLIAAVVLVIGLEQFYATQLLAPFSNALPGMSVAAMRMAPALSLYLTTDADPWLRGSGQLVRVVLGALGLALGIWLLSRFRVWEPARRRRLVTASLALSVLLVAVFTYAWSRNTYYTDLVAAQRLYARGEYIDSAERLEGVAARGVPRGPSTWDFLSYTLPLSDLAMLYYLAGQPEQSLEYSERLLETSQEYAPNREIRQTLIRQARTQEGMAHDQAGDYQQAIAAFTAATEVQPEIREPWVRLGITYNRMGRYQDGIKAANHAIRELDSEAPLAWLVLAQAFVNTGDTTQAQAAVAMVTGLDPDLAARFGDTPEDYRNAVGRLTPEDLQPPLEARAAPPERLEED